MTQKQEHWRKPLRLLVMGGVLFVSPLSALAQLQPIADDTLGNERSIVSPDEIINNLPSHQIDGGARRGANLFHSFQEFNIDAGRGVYFTNPAGIANILTRVTGGDRSQILGTLGVLGNANLFLINPNGILFGANAQLDIRGSFLASTANSVVFDNGFAFSAIDPQAPPLLTVNVLIGLQPGRGDITHSGNLSAGQDLTLSADTVTVQGQLTTGHNLTLEGQTQVQVQDGSALTAGRDLVVRAPLRLLDDAGATLPAPRYTTGGYFITEDLNGRVVDFIIPHDRAIVAEGDVNLTDYAGASLYILAGGAVQLGNVTTITTPGRGTVTPSIATGTGGTQTITVNANPNRGIVDVRAGIDWERMPVSLRGNRAPADLSPTFRPATSANIVIGDFDTAGNFASDTSAIFNFGGNVLLTNQYRPTSSSGNIQVSRIKTATPSGNGGEVVIDSRGNLSLAVSLNTSFESPSETGNGGNIRLVANGNLQVGGMNTFNAIGLPSRLFTGSLTGDGGNIQLIANGDINLDSVDIEASTINGSQGGAIAIQADRVNLMNGAFISSGTPGLGRGGTISITAGRVILQDGATISSTSGLGLNNSADIFMRILSQPGYVFAIPNDAGRGGDIMIDATSLEISGTVPGLLFPLSTRITTSTSSTGRAGDLIVNTDRLMIAGGALITTATLGLFEGASSGGNLRVTARDSIELTGASADGQISSALSSDTLGSGAAGNLTVETGHLTVREGAVVSASTFSTGRSGSISIDADRIELSGTGTTTRAFASGIYAQTFASGNAGNLTIIADRFTASDQATIAVAANDITNSSLPVEILTLIRHPVLMEEATGNAGTLELNANSIVLNARGNIRASSGSGTAGNLDVTTRQLRLDNQGAIGAETASGQGGNIVMQVSDLLLLRRGSTISTTAGNNRTGGDGGNITFNGNFIVAIPNENSDMSANAFTGRGGRVEITAQSILGIQARPQQTPLSDITASSEFGISGVVAIDTPDVDPSRGLLQLPIDLTDISRLIVQACPTGNDTAKQPNEFIITGRGGLPPTPSEAVNRDAIQVDLVTTNADDEPSGSQPESNQNHPSTSPTVFPDVPLVEARGWAIGADGTVYLVAEAPQSAIGFAVSERIARSRHCYTE
jgi:filamentous hemagglutinin family protein